MAGKTGRGVSEEDEMNAMKQGKVLRYNVTRLLLTCYRYVMLRSYPG
jgi:hypothetical protein